MANREGGVGLRDSGVLKLANCLITKRGRSLIGQILRRLSENIAPIGVSTLR